jgi:hypothetical protein
MRKSGCSLDWDRAFFTMDQVRKATVSIELSLEFFNYSCEPVHVHIFVCTYCAYAHLGCFSFRLQSVVFCKRWPAGGLEMPAVVTTEFHPNFIKPASWSGDL